MTSAEPSPHRYSQVLRTLHTLDDLHRIQLTHSITLSPQMRQRIKQYGMDEDDVKSLTLTLHYGLDQNYPNSTWNNESRLDIFRRALEEEPSFLDVNAMCAIVPVRINGNSWSRSFLHDMQFCYDGSPDAKALFDLLLEHGANPNLKTTEKMNALGYNLYSNPSMARRLIAIGCSLNTAYLSDGVPHKSMDDLREEAQKQLSLITADGFDVEQTTLPQLLYAANLDKLGSVMHPRRWKGHEATAIHLMSKLPPYLQSTVQHQYQLLLHQLLPPSSCISTWNADLIPPAKTPETQAR